MIRSGSVGHDVTGMVGLGTYSRERLLSWLNNANLSRMSENLARVLEILRDVTANDSQRESWDEPRDVCIQLDSRSKLTFFAVSSPREALIAELNHRMNNYTLTPRFRLRKGTLRQGWGITTAHERGTVDADDVLLPLLLNAMIAGDLSKLKRCEWGKCGNWFCKRTEGQRFCSDRCREKTFKSSPEFKAERARYMRKNRQTKALLESGGKQKRKSR